MNISSSPRFLYQLLRTMLRFERETDSVLVRGKSQVEDSVSGAAQSAVTMWCQLQSKEWCKDAGHHSLLGAMQSNAVQEVVLSSTSNESELRNASTDEQRFAWLAALRQVAFVGVLKQTLLHGGAEKCIRQTAEACGVPYAVADGVALQHRPLLEMTASELLAQVRLLCTAHGVLTGDAACLDYLTGLLWRVAMEITLTAPSHADSENSSAPNTASLLALSASGSRESICQQLLAEAEVVFTGVCRDCGTLQTFPLCVGLQTPPSSQADVPRERAERAKFILEKIKQITNRKQMQRAIIVARESLLATVLCPYGKEQARRHELTRSGRTATVTLYDRMSYKPLHSMLDDNALVRPECSDTLACVHAVTFATCQVALREECKEWIERQIRWHAWSFQTPPALHLRRVFTRLIDSEDEYHNNLIYYLAKSALANPDQCPPLLLP